MKKGLFIILTFLLLFQKTFLAQTVNELKRLDSLKVVLNNSKHDTTTAATYFKFSEILYNYNIDTVKYLCETSKNIAEKNLKSTKLSKQEEEAFNHILSNALGNLGYYYGEVGEVKKQKRAYLKSLALIKKVGTEKEIANSLNNVGYVYGQLGEVETQKKYYNKSILIKEKIGDKEGAALSLYNLGILHFNQGEIPLALEKLYQALKIQEEINKKVDIASTLSTLGYIYGEQNDLEKKEELYLKSLKVSKEINDQHGMALSYNNLGATYKEQGDNRKALTYFNKCLKISEEIKLIPGISNSLNNIGNIYEAENNIDAALVNYKKSLVIREKINDQSGIISSLLSIGGVLYKQGNYKKTISYALRAKEIALKIGFTDELKKTTNLLQKAYKKSGNYKAGWEAYELYVTMKDSMLNIKNQKAVIKQDIQYEFDKKEALVTVQHEKELAITKSEKKQQIMIIWAVSIILILIVAFSIILINRLRISNSQKLIIEQKNNENELLLGEIHHRVKNNLQVISSLLSLQERNIDDITAKAAILEGKERVKSMGLIHKMLYQNDNYSGVEMDDYVSTLVASLLDSFGIDNNKFDLDIDFSKLKLDVDTAIPMGLIINELVINALKYAYTNTESPALRLKLNQQNEALVLEIADNGKGKIADLNNSNSFGMKLVKSLSRQLGGNILIDDENGLNIQINITDFKLV